MKKDRTKLLVPYSLNSGLDYYIHKQYNRFLQTLSGGIERIAHQHAQTIARANLKAGAKISHSLDEGFQQVQVSQKAIEAALVDQNDILETGFHAIEVSLEQGFTKTAKGLNEVANRIDNVGMVIIASQEKLTQGLAGIKSAVDMGMMNLLTQFELQREEVRRGFDMLADLLENAKKTEARERYKDGLQAFETYLKHPEEPQFLIDARDYLLQSIEVFRGNPFCHLYLGHIYEEASVFYDLNKAQEHYHLCATYAKGLENKGLACVGYFMAAWLSYVQGQVEQAIIWAKAAEEMAPGRIPENLYNLSKYHAFVKNSDAAIAYLDKAVSQFDPMYALKAEYDPDFEAIRPRLVQYFEQSRNREAESLANKLNMFGINPNG